MGRFKYAAGLWALGGAADRFLPGGYTDKAATLKEVVEIAGSGDGIEGAEIISAQVDGEDLTDFKGRLSENNLELTGI